MRYTQNSFRTVLEQDFVLDKPVCSFHSVPFQMISKHLHFTLREAGFTLCIYRSPLLLIIIYEMIPKTFDQNSLTDRVIMCVLHDRLYDEDPRAMI